MTYISFICNQVGTLRTAFNLFKYYAKFSKYILLERCIHLLQLSYIWEEGVIVGINMLSCRSNSVKQWKDPTAN